jgi:hypothetical protein
LVTKIKDESELSELGRALYERMQEPWYFHGETI